MVDNIIIQLLPVSSPFAYGGTAFVLTGAILCEIKKASIMKDGDHNNGRGLAVNQKEKTIAQVEGSLCEQTFLCRYFDPEKMGARSRNSRDGKVELRYDGTLRADCNHQAFSGLNDPAGRRCNGQPPFYSLAGLIPQEQEEISKRTRMRKGFGIL